MMISGGAGLALCRQAEEPAVAASCLAVSALRVRTMRWRRARTRSCRSRCDPLQFVSTVSDLSGTSASSTPRRSTLDERAALPSGHARLDSTCSEAACRSTSITLLSGLPGDRQDDPGAAVRVPQRDRRAPALYLTTVSEPLEKIIRFGQTLDFFDDAAVGTAVFYEDLGAILNERRPAPACLERIGELLKRAPARAHRHRQLQGALRVRGRRRDFRRFLHQLAGRLSAIPANSLLGRRVRRGRRSPRPRVRRRRRDHRALHRPHGGAGDAHPPGAQAARRRLPSGAARLPASPANGLDVFPRLADPVEPTTTASSEERMSSGIARAGRACSSMATGAAPRPSSPARPGSGRP